MLANSAHMQKVNIEYEIIKWFKSVSFASFCEEISKEVIGQENLKLVLAEVRSYIEGLVCGSAEGGNSHNIMIAAPSGTGKTETFRALKKYFEKHIPGFLVTRYDMSSVTAAGFKGAEPVDILAPYFEAGFKDAFGICFLDEFDKKIMPSYSERGNNTNAEVQSQLLTMIEGGDVYNKRGAMINTENLMFIGLGSFNFYREKRSAVPRRVGISPNGRSFEDAESGHFSDITLEDLINAGALYEIVGRFCNLINYDRLCTEAVKGMIDKIMKRECDTMGVDICLDDSAMDELVGISSDSRLGCRYIYIRLHEALMKGYCRALLNQPDGNGIVLHIHKLDDISCEYVPYPKEYLEYEQSYISDLERKVSESDAMGEMTEDEKSLLDYIWGNWE